MKKIALGCAIILSSALTACMGTNTGSSSSVTTTSSSVASSSSSVASVPFDITSTSFSNDGPLPAVYSCEGKNFGDGISPSLAWTAGPQGTKSYAIAFKDMTIINGGGNVSQGYHWVIWNIPASVTSLPQGLSGERFPPAMQGAEQKSAKSDGFSYFGPCPSWNFCSNNVKANDSYSFVLYAFDQANISPSGSVQQIDTWLANNATEVTEIRTTSNAAPKCNTSPAIDGVKFFNDNCSSCHQSSKIANASAAQIKAAFTSGSMVWFTNPQMTDEIAKALQDAF